eukprot:Selendium_serpulae@DN10187_c0_g1_i1.p1
MREACVVQCCVSICLDIRWNCILESLATLCVFENDLEKKLFLALKSTPLMTVVGQPTTRKRVGLTEETEFAKKKFPLCLFFWTYVFFFGLIFLGKHQGCHLE